MFKRILVATDGSTSAQSATSHAIALAKRFGATVFGTSVVDSKLLMSTLLRDLAGSIGFGNFENVQPQLRALLEEKAEAALDLVSSSCEAEGVPCECAVKEGQVATEIVEQAKFADLLVMGKKGEHADVSDVPLGSTVENVVRPCNRPVLLAPPDYRPIRTALAAYDGSAHAYDALRALAEIAKAMDVAIHLVSVGDSHAPGVVQMQR